MRNPKNIADLIQCAEALNATILPNGELSSRDCFQTRRNNNMLIMGTTGASKTRSVVSPNILAAQDSYIIADAKGNLYRKYAPYLKSKGYRIVHLDMIHPTESDGFNPLIDLNSPDDYLKLAHYFVYAGKKGYATADPFWDRSAMEVLATMIGFIAESGTPPEKRTMTEVLRLLSTFNPDSIEQRGKCEFDGLMKSANTAYMERFGEEMWSRQQYRKFREVTPKTMNTILLTIHGDLAALDTPGVRQMMQKPNIDIARIGKEKTAVFVEVSDTDRSKDTLTNTFYSRAMDVLCRFADSQPGSRLPVPVQFILDDFGTNCRIDGFENIISNIRSRGISTMIILQSTGQLRSGFGESAQTIMDNCDTFIFMGGNDVTTAQMIARRADRPLTDIQNMPVSTNWVFQRGRKPVYSRTVDLDEYTLAKQVEAGEYEQEPEWEDIELPDFDIMPIP